ncbi:uncharacterized protein LOC132553929 [Ylistrum balloti]|uniref:uncharacterized protein LOC132553929 n=1 Tax=Ylistrum balloti TaxID=509963 RepID=UPI002905C7CE|nr:uncharacterized protein LOC132553929 [Ylistrum balloti]
MMPRMRMPMRAPHPMGPGPHGPGGHPGGPHGPPMPHRAPHIPPHGRPGPPGHMAGPPRQSMPPPIGQTSVGSVTNDPSTAGARVFVGNLNTIALSKEEVEAIFKRYGAVTGLSMHKGYAFIQYARQADARRACINEDGKMYANQTLDINIASEPKHRQTTATNAVKKATTNFQSTTAKSSGVNRTLSGGGPPAKKMRTDTQISGGIKRTLVSLTSGDMGTTAKTGLNKNSNAVSSNASKVVIGKDVLICGVCKSQFASLHSLAQHKKTPCRLRFSCICKNAPPPESPEPAILFCAHCDAQFAACWDLVLHAQQEHSLSIYKQEGEENTEVVVEEVLVADGEGEVNGE